MAQSVKHPTSAQVMISRLVSSSPTSGSVLTVWSLEPVSDSVSPSLSLCPSPAHALSLSKINTKKKKKKKKSSESQALYYFVYVTSFEHQLRATSYSRYLGHIAEDSNQIVILMKLSWFGKGGAGGMVGGGEEAMNIIHRTMGHLGCSVG